MPRYQSMDVEYHVMFMNDAGGHSEGSITVAYNFEETPADDALFMTVMQPSNPWPGIPEAEDDERH